MPFACREFSDFMIGSKNCIVGVSAWHTISQPKIGVPFFPCMHTCIYLGLTGICVSVRYNDFYNVGRNQVLKDLSEINVDGGMNPHLGKGFIPIESLPKLRGSMVHMHLKVYISSPVSNHHQLSSL